MTDWMEPVRRSQLCEVGEQFGAMNHVRGENLLSRAEKLCIIRPSQNLKW
jgi:hypothetical protein